MALAETSEKAAHHIVAGKAFDAQDRVQRPVAAQPVGMRETAGPGDHGKTNAVKVCASGIALVEVGAGKGIAAATRAPNPTCCKKAMKRVNPPKGVTALGVSPRSTFASPNSGVNAASAVLWSGLGGSVSMPTSLP